MSPMRQQGNLGIVTVTYNSERVLPEFLAALEKQKYASYRLYIVDNNSGDASVKIIMQRPDERIVLIQNSKNYGYAEGANIGIRRAIDDACDKILLVNNDTEFEANFLTTIVAHSVAHDIVVPKIYFYGSNRIWFGGGHFRVWSGYGLIHEREGERDIGQTDKARYIGAASGCCLLVDARVFKEIGLFDEQYFAYHEDVDFLLRAKRAGIRVWFAPDAHLYHKVSSLTGGNKSEFGARLGARNKIYYLRKNFGLLTAFVFSVAYVVYILGRRGLGMDEAALTDIKLAAQAPSSPP